MVDIRQNTSASRVGSALDGAIPSAAGGGIFGALSGGIIGAAYGVLSSLANPVLWIGGLAAAIGAGMGGFGAVAADASWLGSTGHVVAAGIAYGGAIAAGGTAAVHTLTGMTAGMGIGGGLGAGIFGAKGALGGVREANDEDQRYALRKANSQLTLETAKSQARGEAAEYYTGVGYQTGFEEGKNFVVNQIIAAKQQQMMMAQGEPSFVDKHCQGKKSENHVQASEQVAAAIPGQPTV